MTNREFADQLVARLNALCFNREIRRDIAALLEVRVPVCETTTEHPTIQVIAGHPDSMGFLGLLNGITGKDVDGTGLISAVYSDSDPDGIGELLYFERKS